MFVYQIVNAVQESHRGLRSRLAERTRKSKVWWGSHGLEPRSLNPDSGGNPSDVDAYFDYCEEYEATMPGSGLMLSEMVAAELRSRFTASDSDLCQRSMRRDVLKEATEALHALDECDFADANLPKLKEILVQVQEMVNTGSQVNGQILSLIRQKEAERQHGNKAVSFNTRTSVHEIVESKGRAA